MTCGAVLFFRGCGVVCGVCLVVLIPNAYDVCLVLCGANADACTYIQTVIPPAQRTVLGSRDTLPDVVVLVLFCDFFVLC
jgi:hypothetical protein